MYESSGNQQKIVVVQRIFPHYRQAIFDLINDKYELRLIHSDNKSGIPQINRDYSVFRPSITTRYFSYIPCLSALIRMGPEVVIQEFGLSFINLYVSFFYCKVFHRKFILWGHGYNRKLGFNPQARFTDKVRSFFLRRADAVLLYTDDLVRDMREKFRCVNFYVARNSIQSEEKEENYRMMKSKGRETIRQQIGFISSIDLLFIARLSAVKKPELLVNLALEIGKLTTRSLCIHVVGDGPGKDDLKKSIQQNGLQHCFQLHGEIYGENVVSKYIFAADFVVIPAYLGLSVNHSCCYGTPVATLNNVPHPPEVSFLVDTHNGYLCESIEDMAKKIVSCVDTDGCREQLGENARRYFTKNLGIESMYSGFQSAIESTLK